MLFLKLSFFTLTFVSLSVSARSFNPPLPNKDSTGNTRRISIEKRAALALSTDGVANVALYRSQTQQSLGKISRGLANFEKNTGKSLALTLKSVLGPVFDPALSVIGTVINSIIKRSVAADPLVDQSNVLWQGTIQVGTPPVNYTVDLDTGSSDLFLPGTGCTSGCAGHKLFNTSTSSTSIPLNKKFALAYGDGSTVSGLQYNDTVGIAGISVTNQTLGVASNYSGFSTDVFPPDGLLGLGFRAISAFPSNPLFQNLVSRAGALDSPEFAFKLSSVEGESEVTFGGRNEKLFDPATLVFTNVTVPGYWQVVVGQASVDGKVAGSNLSGIIDTGTTLVIGDATTVKAIYAHIPGSKDASSTLGAGFFTYPCNTTSAVSLTFGGRSFNISQATFNLGRVSATDLVNCVGGIVSGNTGVGWIVGDVFLRNTYTIFDFGNKRVGFANLI